MIEYNNNNVGLFDKSEYNIPGIFLFSDLVYQLIELIYNKFGYKMPIKYMYGAPDIKWNNGRLILKKYGYDYSLRGIEKELITARERNIIPILTCSNVLLGMEELKDEKSNEILKIINDINGAIIVASELLEQYILEKYPNMNIHASVIMASDVEERNKDYYDKLALRYNKYVIHPDDNFNYELLNLIEKENAEILLNERCIYQCKNRKTHYQYISELQIKKCNNKYDNDQFLDICSAIPEIKQSSCHWRNISLTVPEVKKIYDLGYRLFKLQGRTDNLYVFFFDLLRYTVDNEMILPTIYPIFSFYIEKFLRSRKNV